VKRRVGEERNGKGSGSESLWTFSDIQPSLRTRLVPLFPFFPPYSTFPTPFIPLHPSPIYSYPPLSLHKTPHLLRINPSASPSILQDRNLLNFPKVTRPISLYSLDILPHILWNVKGFQIPALKLE
jgi:hypothetical protein